MLLHYSAVAKSGVVNPEFPHYYCGISTTLPDNAYTIESAKITYHRTPQASSSTAAPAKGTKAGGRAGTKRGKAAASDEVDADVEDKPSPKKRAKRGAAVGE